MRYAYCHPKFLYFPDPESAWGGVKLLYINILDIVVYSIICIDAISSKSGQMYTFCAKGCV